MTLDPYSALVAQPDASTPVFVDATGRRRRRVRRIAYAVGAACLSYTGLVAASVIGHTPRPGGLTLLPPATARAHQVVSQTLPPEPAMSGVPLLAGDPRLPEDVAAPSRTGSTPTVAPPAPTGLPAPTEPPYQPLPEPTYQPDPTPTGQPEPSVGPTLDLPSAGSGRR